MYQAYGRHIELTRGDTAILSITVDGYTAQDGDVMRFAMKKRYEDTQPILIKTVDLDAMTFRIEHADTESLEFGEYVFDIELTRGEDVYTVIPEGTLTLRKEVY